MIHNYLENSNFFNNKRAENSKNLLVRFGKYNDLVYQNGIIMKDNFDRKIVDHVL